MNKFLQNLLLLMVLTGLGGCKFGLMSFKQRGDSDALRGDANTLPARLAIVKEFAGNMVAGDCLAFRLSLSNAAGDPASPKSPLEVLLTVVQRGDESSQSFYTHQGCSALNRAPRVADRSLIVFGAGVSELTVYVRHTQAGEIKLRAYVPAVQSGDLTLSVLPTGATAYTIAGPAYIGAGVCHAYTVTQTDRYLNTVPNANTVSLQASSGTFYADANCGSSIGSVNLGGAGTASVYYANEVAGESDLSAGNSTIFVVTTQASFPTRLSLEGPTQVGRNLCGRYEVQLVDSVNRTVRDQNTLVSPSGGNFYANPSCTTSIASVLIEAGRQGVPVFYKGSGSTASLSASASGLVGDSENVAITDSGALDVAFGTGGKVSIPFGSSSIVASAVAASGSNFYVAGTLQTPSGSDFAVAKFDSSGNVVTGFGSSGIASVDLGSARDTVHGVAIDANGQVLLVGSTIESSREQIAVVRINGTTGSLDPGFSGGVVKTALGSVGDVGHAVALQPNGQILVVGASRRTATINSESREISDVAVVKFDGDGDVLADNTFDFNSARLNAEGDDAAYSIAVVSNSLAYVAGYGRFGRYMNMAFASINSSLVPSNKRLIDFGENHHDVAHAILVDGAEVYLGGYTRRGNQNVFAIVRLNTSGTPQNFQTVSFGENVNSVVRHLARQEDGMVLAIGYAGEPDFGNAFAVSRLSATLGPDLSFATNGKLKLHLGDGADEAVGGALIGTGAARKLILGGSTTRPVGGAPKDLAATRLSIGN